MTTDLFSAERIKIVLAVADWCSFSKAAAELGVSQPFVSQQIRKMEEEIGRRLLERHTRHVALTRDGEAFVTFARTMLAVGDAARRHFMQPLAAGSLRIGLREGFRRNLLLSFLGEFYRQFPKFTIEIKCDTDDRMLKGLEIGRHDIIIIGQPADGPRGEFLRRFEIGWFGREDTARPIVDPIPLVLPPASDAIRELTLKALSDHGRMWRVSVETSSASALETAIAAGLGISAMTTKVERSDCLLLDASAGLPQVPALDVALLHNVKGSGAGAEAIETFCGLIRSLYVQDRLESGMLEPGP